jgi:dienelactone hydrolase
VSQLSSEPFGSAGTLWLQDNAGLCPAVQDIGDRLVDRGEVADLVDHPGPAERMQRYLPGEMPADVTVAGSMGGRRNKSA